LPRVPVIALAILVSMSGCGKTPTAPLAVATPTPAPTPTPVVLGQGLGCGLPVLSDAIYRLQAEQPSLFNGDVVLDRAAYQAGVARILERDHKVCAKPGLPGDEIAVKNTNDWSEQYDIYQSNARTFNPPGYGVRCRPARF
jgi:hypothetical protein